MKFLVSFVFGLLALIAVRSFLQNRYQTVVTGVTTGRTSNCLAMLGSTTREEGRSTYIVGSIRNDCNRTIGHVTVVFKVDGPNDARFNHRDAIFYAYENDVRPGETRMFKTLFQIGKNDTYRFDGVNAY